MQVIGPSDPNIKIINRKCLACEINAMFYVYVLKSVNDVGVYIGCTNNLKNRVKEHRSGHIVSTKYRLPIELIYYEASLNQSDAFRREK